MIDDKHDDEAQERIIYSVILSSSILKMNVILESIGHETIQGKQVAAERNELSSKDLSVVLIPEAI